VLGLGMAVVVAPLTTTVMSAVESQHAGVASGVNNAVSRVAGLIAIAVFGVALVQTFDVRVRPELDRLALPAAARSALEQELPKLAGADVSVVAAAHRAEATHAIDVAFVAAFSVVMSIAAAVAVSAAVAGAFV
jgi:hypothetical protein